LSGDANMAADAVHDLDPAPANPRTLDIRESTGPRKSAWWRTTLFRGMVDDVRARLPFYASDWVDAWDYRVVPATVYMYFAKWVVMWWC